MSEAKNPTLCRAIPFYRRMQIHLETSAQDAVTKTSLRVISGYSSAITAGLLKLNEYYAKAKANDNNIIATGK